MASFDCAVSVQSRVGNISTTCETVIFLDQDSNRSPPVPFAHAQVSKNVMQVVQGPLFPEGTKEIEIHSITSRLKTLDVAINFMRLYATDPSPCEKLWVVKENEKPKAALGWKHENGQDVPVKLREKVSAEYADLMELLFTHPDGSDPTVEDEVSLMELFKCSKELQITPLMKLCILKMSEFVKSKNAGWSDMIVNLFKLSQEKRDLHAKNEFFTYQENKKHELLCTSAFPNAKASKAFKPPVDKSELPEKYHKDYYPEDAKNEDLSVEGEGSSSGGRGGGAAGGGAP